MGGGGTSLREAPFCGKKKNSQKQTHLCLIFSLFFPFSLAVLLYLLAIESFVYLQNQSQATARNQSQQLAMANSL